MPTKEQYARLKKKNKCSRCGKQKESSNLKSSNQFYRYLIETSFPAEYQTLCYNCNCGRFVNGGQCPHNGELIAKRSTTQQYRRSIKNEVLVEYGGKCVCCGEQNILFLTIDHEQGGGRKHRKEISKNGGSSPFYKWLKDNNFPEGFSTMCFNCNCGRNYNKGICPHLETKNA